MFVNLKFFFSAILYIRMIFQALNFIQNCYCKLFCMPNGPTTSRPARYWMATIPAANFDPANPLPEGIAYIKGQKELGAQNAYQHWQLLVILPKPQRLSWIKRKFHDTAHWEATRSAAAEDYVWKEDTRVEGSQFELGRRPVRRNNVADWEAIWDHAKNGRINEIPAQIRVNNYKTIKQIEKDFLQPSACEKTVYVFWGRSGTGKSRRAWEEAGLDAYPKDPNTKFWDGYQAQENVVIDEFRGKIDISHMLRWLDRYPVIVECKFGAVSFKARKIWITSNKDPRFWYPELDDETREALLRRMDITHFI